MRFDFLLMFFGKYRPKHRSYQHTSRHYHHRQRLHHRAAVYYNVCHRDSTRAGGSKTHSHRRAEHHSHRQTIVLRTLRGRVYGYYLVLSLAVKTRRSVKIVRGRKLGARRGFAGRALRRVWYKAV